MWLPIVVSVICVFKLINMNELPNIFSEILTHFDINMFVSIYSKKNKYREKIVQCHKNTLNILRTNFVFFFWNWYIQLLYLHGKDILRPSSRLHAIALSILLYHFHLNRNDHFKLIFNRDLPQIYTVHVINRTKIRYTKCLYQP